jgi:hypothetical protein
LGEHGGEDRFSATASWMAAEAPIPRGMKYPSQYPRDVNILWLFPHTIMQLIRLSAK